ncbi:MAG: glycosyltransferase family 39 protein [Terracidiphilus sp.]
MGKSSSRGRKLLYGLVSSVILLLICAMLQWHSGAYSCDLAGTPDEPAHVVTGLMVHDYLEHLAGAGFSHWPLSPRAFAETYYVHFPKIAIGHWPPLFYLVQALWMLVFGRTKIALLTLMVVTTAGAATLLLRMMRTSDGPVSAFIFVTAFLLLPVMQESLFSVMPDALLALLACAAMMAGARAIEGGRGRWSLFWVFTVAAMLVHGRGAALLPVPWIALILAGKKGMLRDRTLWIGAALVLLPTVPWFFWNNRTSRLSFGSELAAATIFPVHSFQCLGPVLFALMVLGAIAAPYRKEPCWGIATGLLLGTWMVSSVAIVPWDDRYFICAVPASVVLAALGLHLTARVVSVVSGWSRVATGAVMAGLVGAVSVGWALPLEKKPRVTYESFVAATLAGQDGNNLVYLVAGDPAHEGGFIASVALDDPAVKHFVLRATKTLGVTDWSMSHFDPVFHTTAEMADFLNRSWISLVVIQQDSERPDSKLLGATMLDSKWQPVAAPAGSLAYRRTAPLPQGAMTIRVDMRETMGKNLEAGP